MSHKKKLKKIERQAREWLEMTRTPMQDNYRELQGVHHAARWILKQIGKQERRRA